MALPDVKVTVVGDGLTGKTCMLMAYTTKKFDDNYYMPTILENYVEELVVDGSHYKITLMDTAGQEEYDKLRCLAYPETTCFLLCYAINSKNSFDNISTVWAPELRHHMPHTPIILVATKTDLRLVDNPNHNLITQKKGRALAKHIGAHCYLECSARRVEGVDEIIIEAVRASIMEPTYKIHKKRKCFIICK